MRLVGLLTVCHLLTEGVLLLLALAVELLTGVGLTRSELIGAAALLIGELCAAVLHLLFVLLTAFGLLTDKRRP